jgi:hypothetical protein
MRERDANVGQRSATRRLRSEPSVAVPSHVARRLLLKQLKLALMGPAPEDHGSGLLNGFQALAQKIGVSVPKLDVVLGCGSKYAELRIRVLEERLRLMRIEKYGAGGEKLSQAQMQLFELEPVVSEMIDQAESEHAHAACWAHARRQFFEAVQLNPRDPVAALIVARMDELFAVDAAALRKALTTAARHVRRQERSRPRCGSVRGDY